MQRMVVIVGEQYIEQQENAARYLREWLVAGAFDSTFQKAYASQLENEAAYRQVQARYGMKDQSAELPQNILPNMRLADMIRPIAESMIALADQDEIGLAPASASPSYNTPTLNPSSRLFPYHLTYDGDSRLAVFINPENNEPVSKETEFSERSGPLVLRKLIAVAIEMGEVVGQRRAMLNVIFERPSRSHVLSHTVVSINTDGTFEHHSYQLRLDPTSYLRHTVGLQAELISPEIIHFSSLEMALEVPTAEGYLADYLSYLPPYLQGWADVFENMATQ